MASRPFHRSIVISTFYTQTFGMVQGFGSTSSDTTDIDTSEISWCPVAGSPKAECGRVVPGWIFELVGEDQMTNGH